MAVYVRAVEPVEVISQARDRILERQRIRMRVRHEQHADILPVHCFQEVQGAREVANAVRDIVVDLDDVDAEPVIPVIEAIPLEITLHCRVLFEQAIPRVLERQIVGHRVPPRHEVFPDVVVERQVENRSIHIEHQRLATFERGLRINNHWYTARPVCQQEIDMELKSLVEPIVALAEDAGRAILEVYSTDFDVQSKDDESPLTQADLASHRWIDAGLRSLTPDIPVISEEEGLPDFAERSQWERYWLIDPLDGTKEFVSRNDEFTVNIALIVNHKPVLGVVHVPVFGRTYVGCEGVGASRREGDADPVAIQVAAASSSPARIVGSRSHRGASLDAYLENVGDYDMVPMGSSLKFCVVAEGGADLYPRLGLTSEWDTAAAQAVVEQAGGSVVTLDGKPMKYNAKEDILNPFFFVIGAADRDWLALLPDSE